MRSILSESRLPILCSMLVYGMAHWALRIASFLFVLSGTLS